MSRLFIAAWPSPEVLDRVAELPRPVADGVRWTPRDQWHVTLRFLGKADEKVAAAAMATVRSAPSTATLGPQVSRLGRAVIVVPVRGLDELASAVRDATADVGDPIDPRPFAGHLTLARVKHRGTCGLAGTHIEAAFPVDEIVLVRSELHAAGARYTTVARHPLAP